MSYILAAFFVLALVCGGISGRMAEVSAAAMEGAGAAVELCLSMAGAICLWSGVMDADGAGRPQRKAGPAAAARAAAAFCPGPAGTRRPWPPSAPTCRPICWGWATPPLRWGSVPPRRMAQGCGGVASDELCRLVVLNTASIQLLPTTVASRAGSAHGCAAPLDILPSVWLSSLLSVTAGLLAARGLQARVWRRKWS